MRQVLVVGSEDWVDRTTIWGALNQELQQFGSLTIIHGGLKGAEDIADRWAWGMNAAGHDIKVTKAQMLFIQGLDVVHAFPLQGDEGTRHLMAVSYSAEIPVVNHGYPPYTEEARIFAEQYLNTKPNPVRNYL